MCYNPKEELIDIDSQSVSVILEMVFCKSSTYLSVISDALEIKLNKEFKIHHIYLTVLIDE